MRLVLSALAIAGLACSSGSSGGSVASGGSSSATARIDAAQLAGDVSILAADSMQGRRPGTQGGERARRYLQQRFASIGLAPLGASFRHAFSLTSPRDSSLREGINFAGMVRGTAHHDRYIVVTAHYDHVGIGRAVNGDSIYNGADDNASGTAALLALARWFREHPPRTSIIFVALDAEEMGLRGARAFVASPPVPKSAIVLNVNMDMVGRNARGELYVAGTFHYPFLRPYVERVAARAPVTLRMGHDTPENPQNDWTSQSDHGAFHAAAIPFLYFGVEDHPDYHRPSDEVAGIQPAFHANAVETILSVIDEVDRDIERVARRGSE